MLSIATCLESMLTDIDNADQTGIYLVSSNAGFQSSLQFWQQALRQGVAWASPELFPWTLANAPAAWLARHFKITGPNVTYTGKASALPMIFHQVSQDLFSHRVSSAWVIALDFAQNQRQHTTFSALCLSAKPSPTALKTDIAAQCLFRQGLASTALSRIIDLMHK